MREYSAPAMKNLMKRTESGKYHIMKKYIALLFAVAFTVGCQELENKLPENESGIEFGAQIESTVCKTSLSNDNTIYWSAADQVSVFNNSTVNELFKVKPGTEGSVSCTLTHTLNPSDSFVGGMEIPHIVGYYPYSDRISCIPNSNGGYTISNVEIPADQAFSRESFAQNTFPMVAVNTDKNLSFKNVCGALVLQATGNVQIASVSLQGNSDEILAGAAEVRAYPDAVPSITFKNDASKTVTLHCESGVQLYKNSVTEFIIAIPPTEFRNGFTATFTDTAGEEYVYATSQTNTVGRSNLHIMPAVSIGEEGAASGPITIQDDGLQYVWDESVIPEITMTVSLDEWNRLLNEYDRNPSNKEYVKCNITYKKGSEVTEIIDAGIRLRGNTSRRRPEGSYGQAHQAYNTDWHHCHFGVNLRKYNKNNSEISVKDIKGIRKFNLKWFKDDACYVREVFCYDLFRRAGIWTAAHDVYCRLWIQVEGDSKPAYYGVYEMIEPYDNKYLEKREHLFGNAGGNLWKCSYDSHGPADLRDPNANMAEDNDKDDFTYELKETEGTFEEAKAQLQDFILKLTGKSDESFYRWIKEVCDVELLMRTYAVNVAVGMWDDLWNNGNNYYLYFNSLDKLNYKVYLIPYDYDNSLGTANCYDPAKQDPYNWGEKGLLMERMMKFEEFRNIYRDELKRLVDPANGLMDATSAMARITQWQSKIQDYLINDTGEDMYIEDRPASWGNLGDYNLMTLDNNYFVVKAETINALR